MNDLLPYRIVGGGMTGLTLAYRLAQRGMPVVVHERDPFLGGLTGAALLHDVPVERFYHCILPTDTALLHLFEELHLSDVVHWNCTRTGFHTGTALLDMTTTNDFLRFPALSMMDRLRLGWTIAYCGLNRNWERLDEEPIGPFLRRHGGERLFESIWEPLLLAKLGPNYDRFAASFIWATVYRMLQARKAKGMSEKLGFVQGRYSVVFSALRKAIESLGGSVETGVHISGVGRAGEKNWLLEADGKEILARGIVLCVPGPIAGGWLLPSLPALSDELQRIEYLGVTCEALLLRRSVTPYYVLNLTDRSLPFTGVIEMSNLAGIGEFSGHHLVYLPRYVEGSSPVWNRSEEDLHAENVKGVEKIVGRSITDDIVDWRIDRARFVQPVHPVGWGKRLPPITLASGLAYLSTAHIHPWPVFNDEAVRNVDRHLEEVITTLTS